MNDKYQYADVLKSGRVNILPDTRYKGRGLLTVFGRMLEFQTAVAVKAEDDYRRLELIQKKCRDMSGAWDGERAPAVPEVPEEPVLQRILTASPGEKAAGRRPDASHRLSHGQRRSGGAGHEPVLLLSGYGKTENREKHAI